MYVRKEALLSSQIEGTRSSLCDLLLFENDEIPKVAIDDVQEVSNYVAAMQYGLKRLREGFPLSLRLIREIHDILLRKGRGSRQQPGEFRRTQNWIGGTRPGNALFVPPPSNELPACLDNFEEFLHDEKTPPLIRAALAHVQFESIHPFLDGNGRLGRLLITFMLCADGVLKEPMLYLSLYFKTRRQQYYDLLRRQPLISIVPASRKLKVTHPTVMKAIANLEKLGIVGEVSGRRRGRLFAYTRYMSILNQGTEPPQG
jgi:Fic family protein